MALIGFGQSKLPEKAAAVRSRNVEQQQDEYLSNNIYVGNLSFNSTESDLRGLFEPHGDITSVNVITDRETGRARGFAFVEMADAESASKAIRALDGSEMDGRTIKVNEAQDKRSGPRY